MLDYSCAAIKYNNCNGKIHLTSLPHKLHFTSNVQNFDNMFLGNNIKYAIPIRPTALVLQRVSSYELISGYCR